MSLALCMLTATQVFPVTIWLYCLGILITDMKHILFDQMLAHQWMNWDSYDNRQWHWYRLGVETVYGRMSYLNGNDERFCHCQLASWLIPTCILSRDELSACCSPQVCCEIPVQWEHMEDNLSCMSALLALDVETNKHLWVCSSSCIHQEAPRAWISLLSSVVGLRYDCL